MIALTSTTGKLGGATLNAILAHSLVPLSSLVILTSSPTTSPKFTTLKEKGITIRSFNFDSPEMSAFQGCSKLFLVSTPKISMDFNNAPPGEGREKAHISAIDAAVEAGVKHIYYTSLAFGPGSGAGVMQAHLRTEAYLKGLQGVKYTIIREGLYNESWPLYLGYFDPKGDETNRVVLAGDGKISWTSISDLGVGNAVVLADDSGRWEGKTFYLSKTEHPRSLQEVGKIVGDALGKSIPVKIVSREEYVEYYAGRGVQKESVEWWSTTYAALTNGECAIDDGTLDGILRDKGIKAKAVEETIREMLS